MSWKPKKKEITPEEAIAQAKKDLAPFWHGSSPLLAGVRQGEKYTVHPLDPSFHEKSWMLFFIDPTDQAGELTTLLAREWNRRYQQLGLESLIVLSPYYPAFKNPDSMELWIRKYQLHCPIVVDHDGTLSGAFVGSDPLPKVVVLSKKQVALSASGVEGLLSAEKEIQKSLRSEDPGLPLLPVFVPPKQPPLDRARFDLGRGKGRRFPQPGFSEPNPTFGAGAFTEPRPPKLAADQVYLKGKWIQDTDCIATQDPEAELAFLCAEPSISIVAKTLSRIQDLAKITVDVNGQPVASSHAGADLSFENEAGGALWVDGIRLYHLLDGLPLQYREVTLRFPQADRVAVAIYGVRLSSPRQPG